MATDTLAKVATAIGKLPKDKENKFSGYRYTSEEAVKTAVNRELSAVGIVPDVVKIEILSDVFVKAKQGEQNLVKVRCSIDIEGKHWEGVGAGIDYADKALMKAQTAAVREAWKNGFTIPSGDDPEVPTEDERNRGRPAQRQQSAPRSGGNGGARSGGAEDYVLGFSKNKGKRLGDLTSQSLGWYAKEAKAEEVRTAARTVLDARKDSTASGGGTSEPPSPDDSDVPF